MFANPDIRTLPLKKLIGKRINMSLTDNRTFELWKNFMPRRKEIKNPINNDLFSIQVFESDFDFKNFNPNAAFEKWAALEVTDFDDVPTEMETIVLSGGLYAVFLHKGLPSEGARTFSYIFSAWLPVSNYNLDHRPHFGIMGEKYKNEDPDSEEEIWIPVKKK